MHMLGLSELEGESYLQLSNNNIMSIMISNNKQQSIGVNNTRAYRFIVMLLFSGQCSQPKRAGIFLNSAQAQIGDQGDHHPRIVIIISINQPPSTLHPPSIMYLYNLTLQRPTNISHCVAGNFSGQKKLEIIISRGKILEILAPDENTGKLQSLLSVEIFGIIRSITPFRLTGQFYNK